MKVNNDANDDASNYVGASDDAGNYVDPSDELSDGWWWCPWQTHDNLATSVFEIHPKYYVILQPWIRKL